MLASFITVLVILILVIVYVTWPLFRDDPSKDVGSVSQPISESYEEILQQLRDLDFDHQSGKISSEDHPVMREELLKKAAVFFTKDNAPLEDLPQEK